MEHGGHRRNAEASPALRHVLRENGSHAWMPGPDGVVFIYVKHPRNKDKEQRLEISEEKLQAIRRRMSAGEPLQDFEGILEKPRRKRSRPPSRI